MSSVAIIGSGPAGCYVAEQLLKLLPDAQIDVLEKLPVPFGLIRYGVAPDHQGTKGAARVLDRTLSRDRVSFFGNVEVGRDITLDELRGMYHVVVLATGAPRDRKLGIPGENLPGVIGSGAFVGWYNGHPSRITPDLRDVRSAVIIGNGNVALDVTRILAKDAAELKGSDLPPDVLQALRSMPIRDIHIVGRRSAGDAKFNEHELEELGTLFRAKPVIENSQELAGETPVQKVLRQFAADARPDVPVTIHFHFGLTPSAFTGDTRLQSVAFRSAADDEINIAAQLAVTCIGYEAVPCCSAAPANGVFANDAGKIDNGLYVVGWAKRGPSGTIPTNRAEAQQVAQKIATEANVAEKKHGPDLTEVLRSRQVAWVDYAGWKRIEAAERAAACDERCRLKLLRAEQMLQAAREGELQAKEI
jgi:NADPH-dependent glutamate synthase beta subunit-like oxidoreductase